MGIGLFQLVCKGKICDDIIVLNGNPGISFFNYVYRKHTNFAMENFILTFNSIPTLLTEMHRPSDYWVNLSAHPDVDLLSNLYLIFTLPAIYSSDVYKFRWVENVGSLIIKNARIEIGNTVIDTLTGEWLVIWNELTLPVKDGYNDMTGNIEALNNPRKPETTRRIRNNIISDYDYLASDGITPSIDSRTVSIPLKFWFTKNPSLALPIIRLARFSDIKLFMAFEDIENLYTIYSDIYNMHVSSTFYNEIHNKRININNFIKQNNFIAHIEATYIVLDVDENKKLLETNQIEYLIEKLSMKTTEFAISNANTVNNIDIISQIGVKEIIWTLNRADALQNFNNRFNYTYSIPKNNEKSIIKNAKILWNQGSGGNPSVRVEEKESYFYNKIQPYQHHSAIPMQGIYLYSFSLYPEKWFPSGFYDGSFYKTTISMTFNPYENNYIDTIYNSTRTYDVRNNKIYCNLYTIEYNKLIINAGNIGLKYSN
jgi:hypothetical protein